MKKIILILLIASTSLMNFAEDKSLSLEEAIKQGLKNNFQVQIVREEVNISKNRNSWGAAGRYPNISSSVGVNNRYTNTPSQAVANERNGDGNTTYSFSIDSNWALFSGFKVKMTKGKFELQEKLSSGNAETVMEATVQGIILSYYRVKLEQERLKIRKELMALSRDRYDRELEKKKFGAATTYTSLQYKTSMLQDEANYISQQNTIASAMRELNRLLGNTEEIVYTLTDKFKIPSEKFQLETLRAEMNRHNRSLKNLEINQEILQKDVSIQKSNLWPTLSLNTGAQSSTIAGYSTYTGYANVGISYNIFNGGNTRLAIANAKINKKMGDLRLKEARVSLEKQLRDNLALYNTRKTILNVSDEQLKTASLSLKLSEERVNSGVINSFNYRDIQLAYLNAALNKLQSIYDLIDSKTSLLITTGKFQFK